MSQLAWNILTALTAALLVLWGLYLQKLHKRIQAFDKAFLAPQLRFAYTKEEMFASVGKLGPEGHRLLKRFGWLFLPMLVLAGLAMAVVAHNAADIRWLRWAMYGFTAAGCVLGALETLCLEGGGIRTASLFGRVKWVCFGVWTVGMFAGLFIQSWAL